MADLAKYIRIYDAAPDDDMVTKREAAIKDAVVALRKANTTTTALVALSDAAAKSFGGETPDLLGTVVANAIKSKASSFVAEGRDLEIAVISAIAILEMLEGPDTASNVSIKDILAAAIWSALAFQNPIESPKHEQLRQDLLTTARDRCTHRAEISRKRVTYKEVPEFTNDNGDGWEKTLVSARTAINALETNSSLDREEINILWWALGGRSQITGQPYNVLQPAARGLVRGLELGSLVRRLPSRSLKNLALTDVPDTPSLTLAELLSAAEDVREQVRAKVPSHSTVTTHPIVFPLLSALLGGNASEAEAKSGDQWCNRALLEASLASLCDTPNARF